MAHTWTWRGAASARPPPAPPPPPPLSLTRGRGADGMAGRPRVAVVGGMGLDVMATLGAGAAPRGSTAPGRVRFAHGGVGRNIAEALAALGCDAAMVGAVGRDDAGGALLAALEARGVRTRAVRRVEGAGTQVVACVFGVNGDLHVGVADTAITEAGVSAEWVRSTASHALEGAAWVVLDANLDADALLAAADAAASTGAKLWLEPVSVAKAARVVPALGGAAAVSPNAGAHHPAPPRARHPCRRSAAARE